MLYSNYSRAECLSGSATGPLYLFIYVFVLHISDGIMTTTTITTTTTTVVVTVVVVAVVVYTSLTIA